MDDDAVVHRLSSIVKSRNTFTIRCTKSLFDRVLPIRSPDHEEHRNMKRINIIVSLYTLTALIIIIERLLPITRVLLQPYDFIRLHEINQTVIFLPITVILSFFVLQSVTNNFRTLDRTLNTALVVVFVCGAYLYGAGEGWHEVASFTLNTYCDTQNLSGNLCQGLFINDYYVGNLI